jgi:membrane-associated phospholipid phosphatase
MVVATALFLSISVFGTIAGVPLAEELTGIESYIVPVLKFLLLGVMAGGAVAVFREMIPMARGRVRTAAAPVESEGETQ